MTGDEMKAAPEQRPSRATLQQNAAELYAAGESTSTIASRFGVSDTTIMNWLDELGVKRRTAAEAARLRDGWTMEDAAREVESQIGALLCGGLSDREIARRVGVSSRTVARQRKLAGVAPLPTGSPSPGRDERRERVAASYDAGETMEAIAEREGIAVSTVLLDLRAEGIETRRRGMGPETAARISAARSGKKLGPYSEEHKAKIAEGIQRFWQDSASAAARAGRSERMSHRWASGTSLDETVSRFSGRARQRWFGRWAGREAGKLGGRPRSEPPPEQVAEVLRLADQGWGYRPIMNRLGLTEHRVRSILRTR
jgi:transposase